MVSMATTYHCPSSLLVDGAIIGVGLVPTRRQLCIVPMITLYNFTIITITIIFVIMLSLLSKCQRALYFHFIMIIIVVIVMLHLQYWLAAFIASSLSSLPLSSFNHDHHDTSSESCHYHSKSRLIAQRYPEKNLRILLKISN